MQILIIFVFLAAMKTQIPFIIPQQKGMQFTGQLLHQIVKQSQSQGATIQQIISGANQPTIIATVTQSQPQMVTKVSLTSSAPQGQVQTISGTSPITVTQVTPATRTHVPVTLNIAPVSMQQGGSATLQSGTATVLKPTAVTAVDQSAAASTAVPVHPIQTVAQQKMATISQSLVTQQLSSHPQIQQIAAVSQTLTPTHSPVPIQATTIQVQPTVTTHQATSSPVVLTQASLVQQVPQPAAIATVVTQPLQQGQQTLASPQAQLAKPSPYAMRTRNQPKH